MKGGSRFSKRTYTAVLKYSKINHRPSINGSETPEWSSSTGRGVIPRICTGFVSFATGPPPILRAPHDIYANKAKPADQRQDLRNLERWFRSSPATWLCDYDCDSRCGCAMMTMRWIGARVPKVLCPRTRCAQFAHRLSDKRRRLRSAQQDGLDNVHSPHEQSAAETAANAWSIGGRRGELQGLPVDAIQSQTLCVLHSRTEKADGFQAWRAYPSRSCKPRPL